MRLVSLTLLAFGIAACDHDDIGKQCAPREDQPLPTEPISGEEPKNEIVAVQRNGDCESFQCLTHRGYTSYCTRECEYGGGKKTACETDETCTKPQHCHEGFCQDDDCPAGFVCDKVQDVGPLSGKMFCVKKEGCHDNSDCESLGEITCDAVGCFDSALEAADPATAPHTLVCKPRDELGFCLCRDGSTACTDRDLVCDPQGGSAWPEGSVAQRKVCEPKQQK